MRMFAGDILPAVKDDNRRSEIFDRICSVEHMISSIYMCIENSKWLEPNVRILKELLPKQWQRLDSGTIPRSPQRAGKHEGADK